MINQAKAQQLGQQLGKLTATTVINTTNTLKATKQATITTLQVTKTLTSIFITSFKEAYNNNK